MTLQVYHLPLLLFAIWGPWASPSLAIAHALWRETPRFSVRAVVGSASE